MKPFCLALLILLSPFPLAAQSLPDPVQEVRAEKLGHEIRCTTCQSESIEDSGADMARDLRALVRGKIAAGWSDDQILDYLRARYGDFILLRPPVQANTYLLWMAPVAILILAAGALGFFIRGRAGRAKEGGA